jgi:hypothetical protein
MATVALARSGRSVGTSTGPIIVTVFLTSSRAASGDATVFVVGVGPGQTGLGDPRGSMPGCQRASRWPSLIAK